MIKLLRRRHLQIWLTMGVLLPLGIASAWLVVPSTIYNKLFQPEQSENLPILLKTINRADHTINLRTNADHKSYQLEWINTRALDVPSTLIYQTMAETGDLKNATIIGRIDPRGSYHFAIRNDSTTKSFHFVTYDIIHHLVIEKINL